ncbi:leucine-rich repeat domain-containing protein, partial [Sedimentibacter sp.]
KIDFKDAASLKILSLESNLLSELMSDAFLYLNSLEQLSLGRNNLTELPPGIFSNLSSLKRLYLHENKLSQFSHDYIEGLKNLTYLDVFSNEIAYIDDTVFKGMENLQYLNIRKNKLTSLPSLKNLTNLKSEDFHNGDYYMTTCFAENQLTKEDFISSLPEQLLSDEKWLEPQIRLQNN